MQKVQKVHSGSTVGLGNPQTVMLLLNAAVLLTGLLAVLAARSDEPLGVLRLVAASVVAWGLVGVIVWGVVDGLRERSDAPS